MRLMTLLTEVMLLCREVSSVLVKLNLVFTFETICWALSLSSTFPPIISTSATLKDILICPEVGIDTCK